MFKEINGKITVTAVCPMCGDVKFFSLPADGFRAWQGGELIQRALPDLDANDRERLISGICPACWDKMFSFPDDEEDDEPFDDCDYEMGFDPYLGCFSDDC